MGRWISILMVAISTAVLPISAQVTGEGTANRVPVWTNNTTLGNSNLFQAFGKFGINNSNPGAMLDVTGKPGTSDVFGGNATTALRISGGSGALNASGFGTQGAGGGIQIISGIGGPLPAQLAAGGSGAILLITGGAGATCIGGGTRCALYNGGNGGSISLQPGSGGSGRSSSGHPGNVTLAATGGNVGIGSSAPTATLEIGAGRTTLADAWITRSSRRFKINIKPLNGALEKIQQLQGVSYERITDGQHEIGVVAEDVDQVVPELVSRDSETKEIQGVDYSRLSALLIEAVKSQQAEIEQLKTKISELVSDRSGQ